MKVKVRKYEQLLIVTWALLAVTNYLFERLGFFDVNVSGFVQYLNSHTEAQFDYKANLLPARIGVVLTMIAVYFWINLFTIPHLRRKNYASVFKYSSGFIQLLLLSYILAVAVNTASYYTNPAWNNYAEFSILAWFGYNEHPLTDLWFGFDRSLIFLTVYGIYAGVREYAIHRAESAKEKRNYRILIINQIAAFMYIFLLLP
ncbi:hypothetical protein, partial [Enterococcus innesii]|uniref:hypothetical protein n=1 Tax=Enterococcus innesii TaxID=2839759 RepID=UPI003F83088D